MEGIGHPPGAGGPPEGTKPLQRIAGRHGAAGAAATNVLSIGAFFGYGGGISPRRLAMILSTIRFGRIIASLAVALIGTYWLVERIFVG